MTLLDGFSGIGGFAKGLNDAGFSFEKHFFSETDKHAVANYKYNFKHAEYAGAIETISNRTIPKIDLFTFGWPCQDNSIAGKRKGQNSDTRSGLLFESVRIINELKPRYFIAENVKGLTSVNEGFDYLETIRILAYLNDHLPQYTVEMQLFNTSWFLPQNRERLYFVGHLGTTGVKRIFPITENEILSTKANRTGTNQSQTQNSGAITTKEGYRADSNFVRVGSFRKFKDTKGIREMKSGISPTLNARPRKDGDNQPVISVKAILTPERKEKRQNGRRIKKENEPAHTINTQDRHGIVIQSNTEKGYDTAYEGDSVNYSVPNSKTRRGRIGKKKAQTLDTNMQQGVIQQMDIRRFTEIECERLQGFPDDWTRYGNYDGTIKEISKTQRYKQIGNAVSTVVVKAIGKKLLLYGNP